MQLYNGITKKQTIGMKQTQTIQIYYDIDHMTIYMMSSSMRNYALNSVIMAPAASARAATSIVLLTSSGGGADDPE